MWSAMSQSSGPAGSPSPDESAADLAEVRAALKGIKWRLDALGEGLRQATSCADGTSVGERSSGCAALAAVVDFLESVPEFRKNAYRSHSSRSQESLPK
jgi:hypothetical protein